MITRQQKHVVRLMRYRAGCHFFEFPTEIANEIFSHIDADGRDPNSEISKALRFAVRREENIEENKYDLSILKAMLDANPRLVLYAGNTITRGGLKLTRITLLEFAIYSLDTKLAKLIMPYYLDASIEGGRTLRKQQLAKCRPHVEKLMTELTLYKKEKKPVYNLDPMFHFILNAPAVDVAAELATGNQYDKAYKSELRNRFDKFRSDLKPKPMTEGLHYPYITTLLQFFDLLEKNWRALTKDGWDDPRFSLALRQLLGTLEQSFIMVLRIEYARNNNHEDTLTLKNGRDKDEFNDALNCECHVGVGFESAILSGKHALTSMSLLRAKRPAMPFFKKLAKDVIEVCDTDIASEAKLVG